MACSYAAMSVLLVIWDASVRRGGSLFDGGDFVQIHGVISLSLDDLCIARVVLSRLLDLPSRIERIPLP